MSYDRRLGLVLGAGVARGWAHIGVLQALAEIGVRPDVVCGCSSGAIVGASYVTGRLDRLAERVSKLKLREVLGTLDFSLAGGGLVEGRRLISFFRDTIDDVAIETLTPAFGAVATDLMTGREQWLTSGAIIDAVRASAGLPGVLVPISTRGRWLVDGAMVNPLPVSLCRALGADVIIGVSLNGIFSRLRSASHHSWNHLPWHQMVTQRGCDGCHWARPFARGRSIPRSPCRHAPRLRRAPGTSMS